MRLIVIAFVIVVSITSSMVRGAQQQSNNTTLLSNSSNNHTTTTSEGTEVPTSQQHAKPHFFLFLGVTLLLGALAKTFLSHHIPYTIVMFLFGILDGIISITSDDTRDFVPLRGMPPEFVFYIFFPILIFQGAFDWDVKVFKAVIGQVLLLAFPGILIASLLTAALFQLMYSEWSFSTAMLYGSVISATDPVATVALLRELGADKLIVGIIEGESMFNDGTAMVLFVLLLPLSADSSLTVSAEEIIVTSLKLCFGAVALGIGAGSAMVFCLERTRDSSTEVAITLGTAFAIFYVGDYLCHFSGVITLVTCGVCFSFRRYAFADAHIVNSFWEILVHLANTIIFTMCGALVAKSARLMTGYDYGMLFVLYFGLYAIRCVMLVVLWPILNCWFKISWQSIALIAHSGLRGAVALMLALFLDEDERFPARTRELFVFHTGGIVVLTILFNGCTGKLIVQGLKLNQKSANKRAAMEVASKSLRSVLSQALSSLKTHPLLHQCCWGFARKETTFVNPYKGAGGGDEPIESSSDSVHSIYMRNMKETVMKLHDQGMMDEGSFYAMNDVIVDHMENNTIVRYENIRDMVHPTSFLLGSSANVKVAKVNEWLLRVPVLGDKLRRGMITKDLEMSVSYHAALTNILETLPSCGLEPKAIQAVLSVAKCELEAVRNHMHKLAIDAEARSLRLKTTIVCRMAINKGFVCLRKLVDRGVVCHEDGIVLQSIMEELIQAYRKTSHDSLQAWNEPKRTFQELELLRNVEEATSARLFEESSMYKIHAGQNVDRIGESVGVVSRGMLEYTVNGKACVLGEGTLIGLSQEFTSSDYTAKAPTELFFIPKSSLSTLARNHPTFAHDLWTADAMQIAFTCLCSDSGFAAWSTTDLQACCQSGYLFVTSSHIIGPWVMEPHDAVFVLVQGKTIRMSEDDETAPEDVVFDGSTRACVLPRERLELCWEVESRIFVVPLSSDDNVEQLGVAHIYLAVNNIQQTPQQRLHPLPEDTPRPSEVM